MATQTEQLQAILEETAGCTCECSTNLASEKLQKILDHICDIRTLDQETREKAQAAEEKACMAQEEAQEAKECATGFYISPVEYRAMTGIHRDSLTEAFGERCSFCVSFINGAKYHLTIKGDKFTWTRSGTIEAPENAELRTEAGIYGFIVKYDKAKGAAPIRITKEA